MKYSFIASFYNNYTRRASLIRSFNFDSIDVLKITLIRQSLFLLFLKDGMIYFYEVTR